MHGIEENLFSPIVTLRLNASTTDRFAAKQTHLRNECVQWQTGSLNTLVERHGNATK